MQEITGCHSLLERVETDPSPAVSIVIVCYNQAHYLAQAIRSALAQTHESLEVLVVDDGSTDDTSSVCAFFRQVRYVRQQNRGLAAARNTGLRHSTGEYVAFLDADDRLLPHAIYAGLECLARSPGAALAYGGYRNIFSDGAPAPTSSARLVESDHYWHLLQSNFIGMHGAVLYRKSALQAAGGYNENLAACEDYDLYLRLAHIHPVSCHASVVAEYRQHDHNMSKDYAFMLRSVLKVLQAERRRVHDRRHARALRSGFQVWRSYYGELLLQQWRQMGGTRRLLEIFRLWPKGVLSHFAASMVRRLGGGGTGRSGSLVRFGDLRRLSPFSTEFGFDRGQPIDRHYIEKFLEENAPLIRGRVLEIEDASYSRRFGGDRITQQDVLHVTPGFPGATIIADLANAPQIPSETFDCIILTQTLHFIFDLQAAVANLWRILKPGGTVLVTVPGISQVCRDKSSETDCWRFTELSVSRLFNRHFGESNVGVRTYGNVLAAISFLEGLATSDLCQEELDRHDPYYPVTIAVAAIKGS